MRSFEAYGSVEEFTDQLQQLHSNPDLRLVGSLGRAAWFDKVLGDPLAEYKARGENPLRDGLGRLRDIDIIAEDGTTTDGPHPLDAMAFHNSSVDVLRNGEEWVLRSEDRGFEARLDPKVMEPVHGKTVYGVPCRTLPWQTQIALCEAKGVLRFKDDLGMRALRQAGRTSGQALPEELYLPFVQLLKIEERPVNRLLRLIYRRYIPAYVDATFRPGDFAL